MSTRSELTLPEQPPLPEWLQPLAQVAESLTSEQLRAGRSPGGPGRPAAVLIALAGPPELPEPAVLLSQRASTLRSHAGQVAFPGGARDEADADAVATALREAAEEVALDPVSVQVVATLPELFIPPSGFAVTPVLAWWRAPHEVRARDAAEVARVSLVPLADLAHPDRRFTVRGPSGWLAPGFETDGLFVWGFTAGLLDALLRAGGWEQPWDRETMRALPPELAGRRGATGEVSGPSGSAGSVPV